MDTFIFDYDSTLIKHESFANLLALACGSDLDKQKDLETISDLVAHKYDIGFGYSIKCRFKIANITKDHLIEIGRQMANELTTDIAPIVDKIRSKGHKVLLISGGLMPIIAESNLEKTLSIKNSDCHANDVLYDNRGNAIDIPLTNKLCITSGKPGYIQDLRKSGDVVGKVIMIGDGINDLYVQECNECDIFCGFGVNRVVPKVKSNANNFFEDIKEFDSFINDII